MPSIEEKIAELKEKASKAHKDLVAYKNKTLKARIKKLRTQYKKIADTTNNYEDKKKVQWLDSMIQQPDRIFSWGTYRELEEFCYKHDIPLRTEGEHDTLKGYSISRIYLGEF